MKKNQLFNGALAALALLMSATAAQADQVAFSLKNARVNAQPATQQRATDNKAIADPYAHMTQVRPAGMAQAPSNQQDTIAYQWKWQTNTDHSDGFSYFEDSKLIKAADGNYVGVFTNGDGSLISAGYVKKIDVNGNTLWKNKIQPGSSTNALKLTQGSNGKIYVVGSTLVGGRNHAYVAIYTNDGTEVSVNVLPQGYAACSVSNIFNYGKQFVLTYVVKKDNNTFAYMRSIIDANGNATSTDEAVIDDGLSEYYPYSTLITGNYLLFMSDTFYAIWSLTDASNFTLNKEYTKYYDAKNTSTGVALGYQSANNTLGVMHLVPSDNGLTTEWTRETNISTNYYYTFMSVDGNDNIFVTLRGYYNPAFAMLNSKGTILHQNPMIDFGDSNFNSSFIYSTGMDNDSNFVFVGHGNNYQVYIAKLDQNDNTVSAKSYPINDSYAYSYSYFDQSFFDGDKIMVYGYLNSGNYYDGYAQYFAQFNMGGQTSQVWANITNPGNIPSISPIAGVADAENNSYVIAQSNYKPVLFKYDADGNELWSTMLPITYNQCTPCQIALQADGNLVIAGYERDADNQTDYDNAYLNFLTCYSPTGEKVWYKTYGNGDDFTQPKAFNMLQNASGDLFVISQGLANGTGSYQNRYGALIQKMNANGEIQWQKTIKTDTVGFIPNSAAFDQQGNIVVTGYYYNSNYQLCSILGKFDANGNKLYITTVSADVPLQFYKSWTDSEGNTYAAGRAQINWYDYGFYVVLNNEGGLLGSAVDLRGGSYYDVNGKDNTALICGTFNDTINAGTLHGEVIAIDKQGNQLWQNIYTNGDASTYLYFVLPDKDITALGCTYSSNNVDAALIEISSDGTKTNEVLASAGEVSIYNYSAHNYFLGENRIYTLTSKMPVNPYRFGIVNCFSRPQETGVNELSVSNDNNIKVLRNGDILIANGDNILGVNLFNMMGITITTSSGNSVNVAGLAPGIYIVNIHTTTGIKAVKVRI